MAKILGQLMSGGSLALMVVKRRSLALAPVSVCTVTGVLEFPACLGFGGLVGRFC